MNLLILFSILILFCIIPIIYSSVIYKADNCQRAPITLNDDLKKLTEKNQKNYSDAQKIISTEGYSSYYSTIQQLVLFVKTPIDKPMYIEGGIRGFKIEGLRYSNNSDFLLFKNDSNESIGYARMEILDSPLNTFTFVTQINPFIPSLQFPVFYYDVINQNPSLLLAQQLSDMISKANEKLKTSNKFVLDESTSKFIVALHEKEKIKQEVVVNKPLNIKIIVKIGNFVHVGVLGIEKNASFDIAAAWDDKHGVLWSNSHPSFRNIIQTLNTAKENVFPSIITANNSYEAMFVTTKCIASVEELNSTNLSKCVVPSKPANYF
jgi:hypothetical protein